MFRPTPIEQARIDCKNAILNMYRVMAELDWQLGTIEGEWDRKQPRPAACSRWQLR